MSTEVLATLTRPISGRPPIRTTCPHQPLLSLPTLHQITFAFSLPNHRKRTTKGFSHALPYNHWSTGLGIRSRSGPRPLFAKGAVASLQCSDIPPPHKFPNSVLGETRKSVETRISILKQYLSRRHPSCTWTSPGA